MSFTGFTPSDFKVFEIPGFKPRMDAIKTRIRPKLEAVGRELLPDVARVGGAEAFVHVARHARRTVNPPGDTWVAFALDKSGPDDKSLIEVLNGIVNDMHSDGTLTTLSNKYLQKDVTMKPGG